MRKFGRLTIFILFLALCTSVLAGCSLFFSGGSSSSVKVTNIVLEKSEAYISSYGEHNTFQIYPTIYPENATNKKVIFQTASMTDGAHLIVSDKGLVKGVKPKEGGPIEIVVKSVDNTKITASIYVYVEDKTVERIYFEPNKKDVYVDQKPFEVKAKYYPEHAAEGTNITYTSDNEEVAKVDSITGTVSVLKRGSANIVAENSAGVKGFLALKVLNTPPLYRLEETPSSANSYNQIPGHPERITYTLIPGLNNDANCTIRWFAESKEVLANRNKLTFDYTPSSDLIPNSYNVQVEVKDSDDQMQVVKSKDINVYYTFNDTIGIEVDTTREYYVSDRVSVQPLLNEEQQRPESFIWYARTLTGSETTATLDSYLNYKQVGRSDYATNGGAFTFFPTDAGQVVVAMVPVVNKVPRYEKLKHADPITVNLLESGSPYYNISFTSKVENEKTLLKINWGYMPAESVYVLEININGTTKLVSSTDARYTAFFTDTSVILPEDVLLIGDNAKIRFRTGRYGFGEEYSYTGNSVESNAILAAFDNTIQGLPFNYYAKQMQDVGDIINFVRFFRPGQTGYATTAEGIEYNYNSNEPNGYSHAFQFDLAFGFDFADIDTSKYDKTKKPFDNLPKFYVTDSDKPSSVVGAEAAQFGYFKTDYNEIIDKVFGAFLAYGESGKVSISVEPKYIGTVGNKLQVGTKGAFTMPLQDTQANYARVTIYLKNEPSADTLASAETMKKQRVIGQFEAVKSVTPRGTNYNDYFTNSVGEISVTNGQQLYLAAAMGVKPIPVPDSEAEFILNEAKRILNTILGDDIDTDAKKVAAFHDYLVTEVDYDYNLAAENEADNMSYGFCLEGVFKKKYAVCDGLSKAFVLFCKMENIIAFKISGATVEGVGHAWNKVLVGGKWKLVDTTWDGTYSPQGQPNVNSPIRDYFYKTDEDRGYREGTDRVTYGEYPVAK